ncbi:MAG: DEAD-box ATP-dependent RNA helicase CshA (EC [uncultured Thiotrichaceae bacterium]|uniref:ATP-dependent RNA helicase DeaD n=1 Tax=uncultured Thiotrichaceae bacterium TaxID=298394 RepID=A0A6S6TR94_9GAMM|nr:MAG: DEAD-box ATP-dependent RNA helicase CshA (EC [uncultured Thiotrichaceae bacterium]
MSDADNTTRFDSFGLSKPLLQALNDLGYETPSSIQEACIPKLLAGNDIIGQAQTGTGKTAAFALPLLDNIDLKLRVPQLLILAPTRELAIQVAEAVQSYARHLKGFKVLPIYGGQAYGLQLKPLRQGVHVVVGTPGRVMDHIDRGTLQLDSLKALVLDEADEMLRMGFIDDVKWVMERLPKERQIALFSATMPDVIRQVAEKFLREPEIVKIKTKTTTATTIRQRYWQVSGVNKLDALTRILEVEEFDALIIFVRTKNATVELADKLSARGFNAAAINGDIQQQQRERTITQLKNKKIDILIATDVAARGLDVERISHVVNFDIPYDPESYVHRIGRTGRAGRKGDAILFISPREKRMLKTIERVTRQTIEPMQLPSAKNINERRVNSFKQKITDTLINDDVSMFQKILEEYQTESESDILMIAAALAKMAQGTEPLLVSEKPQRNQEKRDRPEREKGERGDRPERRRKFSMKAEKLKAFPEIDMCRYRLAVGHDDQVKPGNIVGAISNEAEIESCYIGAIEIFDNFSTIDLPDGMPKETFQALKNVWVCKKKLNIEELTEANANFSEQSSERRPPKKGGRGKPSGGRPRRRENRK